MDSNQTVIAAFVKTPHYSPIKTRLAKTVGDETALQIYLESVRQTEQILKDAKHTIDTINGLDIYWAVGEENALANPLWKNFSTLWTGDGGLGERLHHVYSTLKQQYQRVILIGSDCPQISLDIIRQATNTNHPLCIGPTTDGGFYLLSSDLSIASDSWLQITYSQDTTLNQLINVFQQAHPQIKDIETLPTLTDIDDIDSLKQCLSEWKEPNRKTNMLNMYNALNIDLSAKN